MRCAPPDLSLDHFTTKERNTMKLEQATIGKRVSYKSRVHSGTGRIAAVNQTLKGPYFQVNDVGHPKGGVSVRLSQLSLPARKASA
jgi:hypothetical protein